MSRHKFAKRFGGANIAVNASTQSLHEHGATGVTFIRCNFRLDNVFQIAIPVFQESVGYRSPVRHFLK